jgi:hypothetical protein
VEKQNDLEAIFNDDEWEIKDGPELTRRSVARMEAFLATCSVALREEDGGMDVADKVRDTKDSLVRVTASNSRKSPRTFKQIGHNELMHRLELHCRT